MVIEICNRAQEQALAATRLTVKSDCFACTDDQVDRIKLRG
jgi:hypothetical protein